MTMKDTKRSEYSKNRYNMLKASGICVSCGIEKAAPGRVRCLNCLDYINAYSLAWKDGRSDEKKNIDSKRQAELANSRYHARKEAGLCVRCGKQRCVNGLSMCPSCRTKYNNRQLRYNKSSNKKQQWIEQGLCMLCGKERKPGYKLCEYHCNKARESAKKARKKNEPTTDNS